MARKKSLRRAKTPKVRVVLAGRETLVVEAFRALLEPQFHVLGTVTDGRSLVGECRSLNPDVIVLDVAMPTLDGGDVGRELLSACPSAKLVYLTSNADRRVAAEALRLGAAGYVLKTGEPEELKNAIRGAASGHSLTTASTNLRDTVDSSEHLTVRQKEVLQLIAEGRSMKEVAEILHVTPRTVAFHKYKMMGRLNVKSTAELVQFAVKHGVIGQAPVNSTSKLI
jgi:DNA-binding NarL/FixJ family response regulator